MKARRKTQDFMKADSKASPTKGRRPRANSTSGRSLRRDSQEAYSAALYKTELCRGFTETGMCRYGHKCRFAHGKPELRPVTRHRKYKTEKCKNFERDGICPYGPRCRFIHDEELSFPNFTWASSEAEKGFPEPSGDAGQGQHGPLPRHLSHSSESDGPSLPKPESIASPSPASPGPSRSRQQQQGMPAFAPIALGPSAPSQVPSNNGNDGNRQAAPNRGSPPRSVAQSQSFLSTLTKALNPATPAVRSPFRGPPPSHLDMAPHMGPGPNMSMMPPMSMGVPMGMMLPHPMMQVPRQPHGHNINACSSQSSMSLPPRSHPSPHALPPHGQRQSHMHGHPQEGQSFASVIQAHGVHPHSRTAHISPHTFSSPVRRQPLHQPRQQHQHQQQSPAPQLQQEMVNQIQAQQAPQQQQHQPQGPPMSTEVPRTPEPKANPKGVAPIGGSPLLPSSVFMTPFAASPPFVPKRSQSPALGPLAAIGNTDRPATPWEPEGPRELSKRGQRGPWTERSKSSLLWQPLASKKMVETGPAAGPSTSLPDNTGPIARNASTSSDSTGESWDSSLALFSGLADTEPDSPWTWIEKHGDPWSTPTNQRKDARSHPSEPLENMFAHMSVGP